METIVLPDALAPDLLPSCRHYAEHESAAIWSIYAGRSQGIAVRSSIQALCDAFDFSQNPPLAHLIQGVDRHFGVPMAEVTGTEIRCAVILKV